MLTLADVVEGLNGVRPARALQPVRRFVVDSRQAAPRDVFAALRGEQTDGHLYVAEAFSRGAIAALIDRDIEIDAAVIDVRPSSTIPPTLPLPVCLRVADVLSALQSLARWWRARFPALRAIGVTGSVGKSSTKELAAAVLAQAFDVLKSEGNLNNEIGLPLTLLGLDVHHQRAVLEMGMYARGEIAALCAIARPIVGVVTNVGPVHLERLGTLEAVAEAKAELVEALPGDGVAILNYDDERVRAMARLTRARAFFYGLDQSADLWADDIQSQGLEGVRFRLHYRGETLHVQVPLLGRHSVHTALRAAAVGLAEGMAWDHILQGLQDRRAQLRLVAVPGLNGSTILDDTYNASPESTIAALNLLNELEGRKIAVLGDMLELGAHEEEGHRKVGLRAIDVAGVLVTVGERGAIIGEEARRNGLPADRVRLCASNAEAIEYLKTVIEPGDMILVKGSRGLRMEEIVAALGQG
jgi:UDP-N-acetylmuramoyl-tripeptide--D-alanyl-D-alanine ligase